MIINQEVVEWAKNYDGPKFHALLSDPPYHLTSIVKRFGKDDSKPAKHGTDGAFGRVAKGFMGQEWDGGDVAFDPKTWEAFKNIMHDGAFGMAFASSRGWHRMAVAIEDAGFTIHPTIFGWVFGTGFPKATRIDTQIDKVMGKKRTVVGKMKNPGSTNDRKAMGDGWQDSPDITEAASPLSKAWEGHRYGGQALKPAVEPIIVFQKPYSGKPIVNMVKTGAGALNIEATRIGEEVIPSNQWEDDAHPFGGGAGNEYKTVENKGRWPSNFIIRDDGTKDILEDKAKFFYAVREQLDTADPIFYSSKANKKERNAGLEGVTKTERVRQGLAGEKKNTFSENPHPTVKPIELNKYLATMLLPPDGYSPRRIFVPFGGVMSEAIGAALAGWEEVTAVEMSKEYCDIGLSRVKHWAGKL